MYNDVLKIEYKIINQKFLKLIYKSCDVLLSWLC